MNNSDTYRIKELNAPNMTFINLCEIFSPLSDMRPITIYIDKLIFKAESLNKNNQFNNVIFKMATDASGIFTFNLSSPGRQFSATTDKDKLHESVIVIANYKETVGAKPQAYNVPEALTAKPLSEELARTLGKKKQESVQR